MPSLEPWTSGTNFGAPVGPRERIAHGHVRLVGGNEDRPYLVIITPLRLATRPSAGLFLGQYAKAYLDSVGLDPGTVIVLYHLPGPDDTGPTAGRFYRVRMQVERPREGGWRYSEHTYQQITIDQLHHLLDDAPLGPVPAEFLPAAIPARAR